MGDGSHAGFWRVVSPRAWPAEPEAFSYSALAEIEACPRRWALTRAEHPGFPEGQRYPRPFSAAASEGVVIHAALEGLCAAFAEDGVLTVSSPEAIATLRRLGGYTQLVTQQVERTLERITREPRVEHRADEVRRSLLGRVPMLRTAVQRLVAGLERVPAQRDDRPRGGATSGGGGRRRPPLREGAHAEVLVRAPSLGWLGVIDLLLLDESECEVSDYKTGDPKPSHEEQVRIYALLWKQDAELNPSSRAATTLTLRYPQGTKVLAAPADDELEALAEDLATRTRDAVDALNARPPRASVGPEACGWCAVRHLCDAYWSALPDSGSEFCDLEVRVDQRHGPRSWDAEARVASGIPAGAAVLVRESAPPTVSLRPGQRLRILNAHVHTPDPDPTESSPPAPIVTLGKWSECFEL